LIKHIHPFWIYISSSYLSPGLLKLEEINWSVDPFVLKKFKFLLSKWTELLAHQHYKKQMNLNSIHLLLYSLYNQ
jgi:hypothetical protein